MSILDYIKQQLREGRVSFTLEQAQQALNSSRHATISALSRLRQKGQIISPAKQFYLIISPEYEHLGCLPPEQFIPHLMAYWNSPYYVGLLSAAEFYGAAHQKSQHFQVIAPERHRNLKIGKISIHFIQKKVSYEEFATRDFNTPRSRLKVSTPEITAIDLVNYPWHSGGMNHVATVLTELAESINSDTLNKLAEASEETAWIQRLGYLLMKVGHEKLTEGLSLIIENRKPSIVALNTAITKVGYPKDKQWRISINMHIESDI